MLTDIICGHHLSNVSYFSSRHTIHHSFSIHCCIYWNRNSSGYHILIHVVFNFKLSTVRNFSDIENNLYSSFKPTMTWHTILYFCIRCFNVIRAARQIGFFFYIWHVDRFKSISTRIIFSYNTLKRLGIRSRNILTNKNIDPVEW